MNKPDKCPWCGSDKIEKQSVDACFEHRNIDISIYFCMEEDCDWNSEPFER